MESWGAFSSPDLPFAEGCRARLGTKSFWEDAPKHAHCNFGNNAKTSTFSFIGLPGQTNLLDRFGSEFCVEPQFQSQNISGMSQN